LSRPPSAKDRYRDLLSDPDFQIFYHAPVLIVISAKELNSWAVEDCSLAGQNLMLAAYAAGLGTCWIGFANPWLNTPEGKAVLGLGSEIHPRRPDYRRPSQDPSSAGPAQRARSALDRVNACNPSYTHSSKGKPAELEESSDLQR
jgi:nitroreductase